MDVAQDRICASLFSKNLSLNWCLIIVLVMYLANASTSLRLTSMTVPVVADLREIMELDCHFDMGNEELYAVKWYKDDQEFFRYMPRGQQKTRLFPVAGIKVEPQGTDCNQHQCKIALSDLSRIHSGGAYRCEISSEAPSFRLASETHNVTVAALPRGPPKIDGLSRSYSEGDNFNVKCTSDYADPEPILMWKINNLDPPQHAIAHTSSSAPDHMGLVARTVILQFTVDKRAPHGSDIEIRCESAQPGVPELKKITSQKVSIRRPGDPQVVNNQKWYSSGSYSYGPSFHIAWLLIWSFVVKWIVLIRM